jgi:ubiquinone/menaquinone biosynthesis C-methylase UbiE
MMMQIVGNQVVAGYDAVYAGLPRSPTLRRVWRQQVLGPEYPVGFEHLSFVTLTELRRMAAELGLAPGGTLVDLGCGGGGPGLWIAGGSGGRLLGIDASRVAIANARGRAQDLGLLETSRFATAPFERLPVRSESADAVMSVDALQYSTNKRAAFAEVARILKPGRRFVFTVFEIEAARVSDLPVLNADAIDDYRPILESAGFAIHLYDESEGWKQRVTRTYEVILDMLPQLTQELSPHAAAALGFEVSLVLQRAIYSRRVFAAAVRER